MARKSETPKASTKGGYGKPPKHSQFKKGQSGNPKGRPKKSHNFDAIVESVIMGPVTIHNSGKKEEVPALKALAMKMLNDALNGNHASGRLLLNIVMNRDIANSNKGEANGVPEGADGIDEKLERLIENALREDELSGPEAAPSSDKPPKK